MSHNKRKPTLDVENRASRDVRSEQEKKAALNRDLSLQVQERLAQKEAKRIEEELANKKLKLMSEKMEADVQKHINKTKSNAGKKETLAEVLHSNANCINTALSMNYVLKHRDTTDYNTLTEPLEPRPEIIRNDSSKQAKMCELKTRLESAKQEAIEALEEKQKSESKLFELKAKLIQMKADKESYMNRLNAAISRTKIDDKSRAFDCDTAFVPIEDVSGDVRAVPARHNRNSVDDSKPAYRINSGVRRWSSRQPGNRCEQEIRDLNDLIDNYHRK